jgi:transcriptional regulator with XRE-family HTH domain
MVKRHPRTVTPNGEVIRKLRRAKGKTQEDLVSGAGITHRTLQRAEQSHPIGSRHLTVIAERLEVPPERIIKDTDKGEQPKEKEEVIRLNPVRGRQLIEWLQFGPDHVWYHFDVDPHSETSELIAEVIEACDQYCSGNGHADRILEAAGKIRAIGALNDKLCVLAARDVGVFASQTRVLEPDIDDMPDGKTRVWTPGSQRYLLITFAPVDTEFVNRKRPLFYTKQSLYESCARHNLEKGLSPEAVEASQLFADSEFLSFYRTCWNSARAETATDAKVIPLLPRD